MFCVAQCSTRRLSKVKGAKNSFSRFLAAITMNFSASTSGFCRCSERKERVKLHFNTFVITFTPTTL